MMQFYKNFLTMITALIIALLVSFDARAQEIDVVTELLEPYQIEKADGSLGGFSTEVVEALFKITKDQASIKIMPWARAYEVALNQPNTLIYSIAHTQMRDKKFHWIGALKKERLSSICFKELKDCRLKKFKLCTIFNCSRFFKYIPAR
jgi:polar amino acid transport system substrate-binding protein